MKTANRNNSTLTIIISEQLDEAKLVSSGCDVSHKGTIVHMIVTK